MGLEAVVLGHLVQHVLPEDALEEDEARMRPQVHEELAQRVAKEPPRAGSCAAEGRMPVVHAAATDGEAWEAMP